MLVICCVKIFESLTQASCIFLQGNAYKVAQAEVPEDEPGATNYVFKPVSTEDVLSDKAAHLEVIRQVSCLYMPLSYMHALPGMLSKSSHPRLTSRFWNCTHANQSTVSPSSQLTSKHLHARFVLIINMCLSPPLPSPPGASL